MRGRGRRFTVAGLLWAVAVSGLWLASLRSSSVLWTRAAATMTLAALLTAVLGTLYARGLARAFWVGFALFGWAYLVLVNWDWVGGQFGHDLTGGLSDLAERLLPDARPVPPAPPAGLGPRPAPAPRPNYETLQQRAIQVGNFVQIGRMSLCLLFALLGGAIARAFASRAET